MSVIDITTNTSYATLSAAIAGSSANDTLQVPAGSYVEDFPDITHSLTITAVGGLASLTRATPLTVSGRAILNVPLDAGVNLSIDGLEIHGAARPGANPNGAGILFEVGNGALTVSHSWIHGNEDGILTGAPDAHSPGGVMTATISHSDIGDNGAPPGSAYAAAGSDHNIYAGALTSLTVTDSYIHGAFSQGHEIKSRALTTTITNNRIFDLSPRAGALGTSYDIDVPNGGNVTITGNVIEKGPASVNRYVIHFGGEGTYQNSSLFVDGNTIINDRSGGATAAFNQSPAGTGANIPSTITNNTLYGLGPGELFQDGSGSSADTVSGNMFPSGAAPALDTTSPVACFAAGTRIATDRGPVPVEALRMGDRVRTAQYGHLAPVRWIGHRTLDCARHGDPDRVRPVRIAPHAFGPNRPERPLYLSPDHAVCVDGVLIPVRLLVNGGSITVARDTRRVTYYHVELPAHDILLAEGLPAESYLDTGNRGAFENSGQPLTLHPRFGSAADLRVAGSRLPLATGAAAVEPVWRALAERAASLGLAPPEPPVLVDDPDLRILVAGRRIGPVSVRDGRHLFAVPAGGGSVSLLSRAGHPAAERPWIEDRRRLGVRIGRLTWRCGAEHRAIPLDHAALDRGWWAVESDGHGPRRWTKGRAVIPESQLPRTAPGVLEVVVTESIRYALPAAGRRELPGGRNAQDGAAAFG